MQSYICTRLYVLTAELGSPTWTHCLLAKLDLDQGREKAQERSTNMQGIMGPIQPVRREDVAAFHSMIAPFVHVSCISYS